MAKVLVIDDSLSVRKVVERTLGSQGMQVLSVGSGTEAKAAVLRDQPDLIVCDVILPDADGFEICNFVRTNARLGKTPVLLMSGIINAKVAEQAARVQANDLMCKPFAADELVRKTTALLSPQPPTLSTTPAQAPAARPTPAPAPQMPPPRVTVARPVSAAPARQIVPERQAVPTAVANLDGRVNAFLGQLAALPGVKQVVLVDREGFVIGSANASRADGETAGALVSCLRGPFEGMGEDLGHGALQGIIVEYARGIALIQNMGTAVLTAILSDPTALGKVRYYVKRSLPALFPQA